MNHKSIIRYGLVLLACFLMMPALSLSQDTVPADKTKKVDTGIKATPLIPGTPPESSSQEEIPVQKDEKADPGPETTPSPSKATAIQDAIKQTKPNIPWSISVSKVIWSVIIVVSAYLIIRYLTIILDAIAERWVNLRLPIKRMVPFIRVLGWLLVIYTVIESVLAPPIETLLALTASAGIALGFASQDILKNVFGGIMILLDRPFHVGDKIEINQHYGEVIQIGLRTVRVVTPDDSVLSIPNSEVVNQTVSNSNSGEFNCQVVSEFFLPPDLDLVLLKKIAFRAAAVSRYTYLNKPIAIIFKNELSQGRSLLKMRLKAYVLDIRYEFPFASEMTELVLKELIKKKLVTRQDLNFYQPGFQT